MKGGGQQQNKKGEGMEMKELEWEEGRCKGGGGRVGTLDFKGEQQGASCVGKGVQLWKQVQGFTGWQKREVSNEKESTITGNNTGFQ